jgi:DNA-binding NtrC family response regulator
VVSVVATADGLAANLRLLRRVRVLVVSRDRRFLSIARFLLAREDYVVDSTSRPGELFERVRDGADVVVIDGTGSLATAARTAAEIEALYPGIGLVVVAEDGNHRTRTLRVLPKWGSLEELGNEIQRAYLRLGRQDGSRGR